MTQSYLVWALNQAAKGFVLLFLATVPQVVPAALPNEPLLRANDPVPSPKLGPSEVVRIQVEALRKNSLLNEGIELTYRFASAGNKRYTGPLSRFTEMVRSAPYDRLLNHLNARYDPVAVSGNRAYQMVTITDIAGEKVAYVWVLSRQSEGEFKNCWMADAVIPAERSARRKITRTFNMIEATFAT